MGAVVAVIVGAAVCTGTAVPVETGTVPVATTVPVVATVAVLVPTAVPVATLVATGVIVPAGTGGVGVPTGSFGQKPLLRYRHSKYGWRMLAISIWNTEGFVVT